MKKIVLIILYLSLNTNCSSQNFPYKFNRAHTATGSHHLPCEYDVNVSDNRPTDCIFGGNFVMYPVLVEDFNFKEELPNNWRFTMSYNPNDDNYGGKGLHGITYLGNAYNNNVYTENGIGYLQWKKETVSANSTTYNYTGAFLSSLNKLRQGVFEARILLPNYPIHFPAFWLLDNQEIDIFEFDDKNIANGGGCQSYHHMKCNIHGWIDASASVNYSNDESIMTHCNRNVQFGVSSNHFENWHTYKCVWTDYQIQIYLDGTLVTYASKYYDDPFFSSGVCDYGSTGGYIPMYHRDCNYMSSAPDCSIGLNVPNFPDFWHTHWECWKKNKVFKDVTFPETTIPMSLIISNSLAYLSSTVTTAGTQLNTLNNAWDGLGIDKKRIGIDWIKIYQPVVCSAPRTICSLADFKAITGNTNFLSGSTIEVGIGCQFINNDPDFPTHFLYSENIIVDNANFIITNGAYAEIRPIDCTEGFNQYQRTTNTGEKLFLTEDEIAALEQHQQDSLMANDPEYRTNIMTYEAEQNKEMLSIKSKADNGAILIHPNPTENYLMIDMPEEDFYDLYSIEIIDNLGRSQNIEKTAVLDVSHLSSGFYQLKFKFTHGVVVVKNFVKK